MLKLLASSAAVLALATGLAFASEPKISAVEVEVELSDMDETNALEYWPEIEADLTAKILDAARPMLDDDGYEVEVKLKEVSLSGSKVLSGEGEFNRMAGWVYVRKQGELVPEKSVEITLDAETGALGGNSDIAIIPGKPMFYAALINSLARRTVEEIGKL